MAGPGRLASAAIQWPSERWVFYFVIPRASRAIQQPRAQSVLQAFLDAATARSMTWWYSQPVAGFSTGVYSIFPCRLPVRSFRG